jgi:hypothetical protein
MPHPPPLHDWPFQSGATHRRHAPCCWGQLCRPAIGLPFTRSMFRPACKTHSPTSGTVDTMEGPPPRSPARSLILNLRLGRLSVAPGFPGGPAAFPAAARGRGVLVTQRITASQPVWFRMAAKPETHRLEACRCAAASWSRRSLRQCDLLRVYAHSHGVWRGMNSETPHTQSQQTHTSIPNTHPA